MNIIKFQLFILLALLSQFLIIAGANAAETSIHPTKPQVIFETSMGNFTL